MQPVPVTTSSSNLRVRVRTAVVTSADSSFRQRLSQILTGLRWQVREADGGAQTWAEAESAQPEAVIVDSWLPDLDLVEFLSDFIGRSCFMRCAAARIRTPHRGMLRLRSMRRVWPETPGRRTITISLPGLFPLLKTRLWSRRIPRNPLTRLKVRGYKSKPGPRAQRDCRHSPKKELKVVSRRPVTACLS